MPIDPNIILQAKPAIYTAPDPMDQYARAATIKGLLGQQDLHSMQLDTMQRDRAAQDRIQALLAKNPNATAEDVGAIDFKSGLAYGNARLEAEKARSGIDKDRGTTLDGAVKRYRDGFTSVNTPQDAAAYMTAGYNDPILKPIAERGGTLEQAISKIPTDPAKFQEWKTQHMLDAEKLQHTILEQQKMAQTASTAFFTPGANGQPVANTAAQDFELQRKRAGKPVTNVNVSTEKKYGEQFAGKMADQDAGMLESARKAPDLAARSNQILQVLDSGKIITGTGADARLAIGKALNLTGGSDAETIANTETLSAQLARNTLDAIKASGLGAGNGFSNADRDFLEKAVGGKITLEPQTISRLATLSHKAAEQSSQRWGARAKQIPADALSGTGISTDPIEVPSLYQMKNQITPTVPSARPAGKPGIKFLGYEAP